MPEDNSELIVPYYGCLNIAIIWFRFLGVFPYYVFTLYHSRFLLCKQV